MEGVSGIVATSILLALTIAGGLLLYAYISRYLASSIQSSEVVIDSAYYLTPLRRLEVTVRNIGMNTANITSIEVIFANSSSITSSISGNTMISPGETRTISITNIDRPLYVIVYFDNTRKTEPAVVRIIG
jgi:flagellin-like protein